MFLALDVSRNNCISILNSSFTKFKSRKPVYVPKQKGTVPVNVTKELKRNKDTVVRAKKTHNRPKNVTDYEKGHEDLCKNSWQDNYTKLHQNLIETNQKFLVHICPRAGWGNRFVFIIAYLHFAVITKRAYIIICNRPSPLDKYLSPRNIKWNYEVNFAKLSVRRNNKFIADDIMKISNTDQFRNLLHYSVEYNPILVGNDRKPRSILIPLKYDLPVWPDLGQMAGCSFHYLFRKSDYLQRRLDEWKEELGFNENIVLGIHIREGDRVFPFRNPGPERFVNLEEDINFTFTCAEQIQKEIEKKHNTDKVIWFLAADSEKRKGSIKQKYGSKVRFIFGPVEHIGRATSGNGDRGHLSMFLDFFLLQEADYRLYSSPSTFPKAVNYITLGSSAAGGSLYMGRQRCQMPQSLINNSGASATNTN